MSDAPSMSKPVELEFARYEPSVGADANRSPVLLGHGLFGNKKSWADSPQKLADQTRRTVFVVDLRDHGDSPRTDELTFKAMLSDVRSFLDEHVKSAKVCLVGHSLSGMLFASFATTWPDRVESVVMLDIDPIKKPEKEVIESAPIAMLSDLLNTIRREKLEELEQARKRANELISPMVADEGVRNRFLENLVTRDGKIDWSYNLDTIIKHWPSMFGFDDLQPVGFSLPALEIIGSESLIINSQKFASISEKIPNCKFAVIPNADHSFPLTHPNEFVAEVVHFLEA